MAARRSRSGSAASPAPAGRATRLRPRSCPRRCTGCRRGNRRRCSARSPSTSSSRTSPSSTTGSGAGSRRNARVASSASRWPRRSRGSATRESPRRSCRPRPRGSRSSSSSRRIPPRRRGGRSLASHQRIAGLLHALDDPELPPSGRGEVEDSLAEEITILWQTDELRSRRPRVVDEIRQGLWFVERGLWEAAPSLLADWRVRLPGTPLRFGTWIGADLDGNPSVGPDTVEEAVERAHALALRLYAREVRELAVRWGMAEGVAGADPAVGEVPLDPELNRNEPYRRRLTVMWERLEADGYRVRDRARGRARAPRREPPRARWRTHRRRWARGATAAGRRLRPPPRDARAPRPRAVPCASRTRG